MIESKCEVANIIAGYYAGVLGLYFVFRRAKDKKGGEISCCQQSEYHKTLRYTVYDAKRMLYMRQVPGLSHGIIY